MKGSEKSVVVFWLLVMSTWATLAIKNDDLHHIIRMPRRSLKDKSQIEVKTLTEPPVNGPASNMTTLVTKNATASQTNKIVKRDVITNKTGNLAKGIDSLNVTKIKSNIVKRAIQNFTVGSQLNYTLYTATNVTKRLKRDVHNISSLNGTENAKNMTKREIQNLKSYIDLNQTLKRDIHIATPNLTAKEIANITSDTKLVRKRDTHNATINLVESHMTNGSENSEKVVKRNVDHSNVLSGKNCSKIKRNVGLDFHNITVLNNTKNAKSITKRNTQNNTLALNATENAKLLVKRFTFDLDNVTVLNYTQTAKLFTKRNIQNDTSALNTTENAKSTVKRYISDPHNILVPSNTQIAKSITKRNTQNNTLALNATENAKLLIKRYAFDLHNITVSNKTQIVKSITKRNIQNDTSALNITANVKLLVKRHASDLHNITVTNKTQVVKSITKRNTQNDTSALNTTADAKLIVKRFTADPHNATALNITQTNKSVRKRNTQNDTLLLNTTENAKLLVKRHATDHNNITVLNKTKIEKSIKKRNIQNYTSALNTTENAKSPVKRYTLNLPPDEATNLTKCCGNTLNDSNNLGQSQVLKFTKTLAKRDLQNSTSLNVTSNLGQNQTLNATEKISKLVKRHAEYNISDKVSREIVNLTETAKSSKKRDIQHVILELIPNPGSDTTKNNQTVPMTSHTAVRSKRSIPPINKCTINNCSEHPFTDRDKRSIRFLKPNKFNKKTKGKKSTYKPKNNTSKKGKQFNSRIQKREVDTEEEVSPKHIVEIRETNFTVTNFTAAHSKTRPTEVHGKIRKRSIDNEVSIDSQKQTQLERPIFLRTLMSDVLEFNMESSGNNTGIDDTNHVKENYQKSVQRALDEPKKGLVEIGCTCPILFHHLPMQKMILTLPKTTPDFVKEIMCSSTCCQLNVIHAQIHREVICRGVKQWAKGDQVSVFSPPQELSNRPHTIMCSFLPEPDDKTIEFIMCWIRFTIIYLSCILIMMGLLALHVVCHTRRYRELECKEKIMRLVLKKKTGVKARVLDVIPAKA